MSDLTKLGREVGGFDDTIRNEHRYEIVVRGLSTSGGDPGQVKSSSF
ncbi:hypothetical protein [Streptosporangium amethystogenes]|nr:hypothetical protein [Streptosporangium amethystogenes]